MSKNIFLLLILPFIVCSSVLRAQDLSRADVALGVGIMGQFAKLVNEKADAGPTVSLAVALRTKKNSRLSVEGEYFYMHSTFSRGLVNTEDVEARFASLNFRFDLETRRTAWAPYFSIGFGVGGASKKVLSVPWDNKSPLVDSSYTGTTAINFGVGFNINVWEHSALFTRLRFVIGEESGLSIPLILGYRYEL